MVDNELLTVGETAEFLKISVHTVYQWKHLGKIPFVKLHGKLLFKRSELVDFIDGFRDIA